MYICLNAIQLRNCALSSYYRFSDIKFHIVAQALPKCRAKALRYFGLTIDYEIIFMKIYTKGLNY